MTEFANTVPASKPASSRCLACRLSDEVRTEIERDRIRGWATFARLAAKLASKGFTLSESAVRRHFRHVDRDRYFEPIESEPDAADLANTATPFDALISAQAVSDLAVCEVMVRASLERVQRLEQARRATRDPTRAESLMRNSRDELQVLERALRRLTEVRKPRDEMKKTVGEVIDKLAKATADACCDAMTEHLKVLNATTDEYAGDRLRPEHLAQRVARFQSEWPDRLSAHLAAATVPIIREAQAALG
jgi:hypothetical protein